MMKPRVYLWISLVLVGISPRVWSGTIAEPPTVLLKIPETIREEQILWKGSLVPDSTNGNGNGGIILPDVLTRNPPMVSIGQPETSLLTKLYPLQKMPLLMQAQLREADFYLIRLFCSFRPIPGENRVDWARFYVHLHRDAAGRQPIAYDAAPLDIRQEVKRQVMYTLAPTLKFHEVQAEIGKLELAIEYPELQPLIIAAGIGEASPSWDYMTTAGIESIQGVKWMHLLVKAPKGMKPGRAILRLTARVHADNFSAWFIPPSEASEDLQVQLWE